MFHEQSFPGQICLVWELVLWRDSARPGQQATLPDTLSVYLVPKSEALEEFQNLLANALLKKAGHKHLSSQH